MSADRPSRSAWGRSGVDSDAEVVRFAETLEVAERQIIDLVRQGVVRERLPDAGPNLRRREAGAHRRHSDSSSSFPSVVVLTVDVSIIGLTQTLLAAVEHSGWEFGAAVDDPADRQNIATFGTLEGSLRRAQGVPDHLYRRLLGIYRVAFLEAVHGARIDWPAARLYSLTIDRFFDYLEAGAAGRSSLPQVVRELAGGGHGPSNRAASRDGGEIAVVLLDDRGGVEHANDAAARLFRIQFTPESLRARSGVSLGHLSVLAQEIAAFIAGQASQFLLVWALPTTEGKRQMRVHFKRRYTASGGPAGVVIACSDLNAPGALAA